MTCGNIDGNGDFSINLWFKMLPFCVYIFKNSLKIHIRLKVLLTECCQFFILSIEEHYWKKKQWICSFIDYKELTFWITHFQQRTKRGNSVKHQTKCATLYALKFYLLRLLCMSSKSYKYLLFGKVLKIFYLSSNIEKS